MYTFCDAEYENTKQYITFDFCFGTRYPKFLLTFCMVGSYCISCPLIAPVGLLFMSLKHLVDKYNLYYAYEPVKINDSIHESAISFFYIGVAMMQVQVFLISYLRTGYSDVSGFMIICLIVTSALFLIRFCCGCTWVPSLPDSCQWYCLRKKQSANDKREFCACLYLPPVLYDLNGMQLTTRAPRRKPSS